MSRAPTPRVQLDGDSLVGPMGEFYADLGGASEAFKARAVVAINCHDDLVAALRELVTTATMAAADTDEYQQFVEVSKASIERARAALAKVA